MEPSESVKEYAEVFEDLLTKPLIIGATGITYNVPLVTRNLQRFERLQEFGLQLTTIDEL